MTPPPSLYRVAWIVLRDVNRTLGGGIASMEMLRRSAMARGWLDEASHGVLTAVSRLTPGTNVIAYCAGLGWWLHGAAGAAVALLAASVPAALVAAVASATLVRLERFLLVRSLLAAGTLVAAMLVLSSAWSLTRPYLAVDRRVTAALIAAISTLLLWIDMPPVQILLAAAIVGALGHGLMPQRVAAS